MIDEPRQDETTAPPTPIIPWDSGGVLPGFTLTPTQQEWLHKQLGRDLPPEVYRDSMTGHRILVAPKPVSERWGGMLFKPRSAQEREQAEMGVGWVVSVGPLVGAAGAPHPTGVLTRHPADLLGRQVIYQQYAGTNIKTNEEDTEFGGKFSLLVLTDRDVLQVGRLDEEFPLAD